jgi:hypothetical protein
MMRLFVASALPLVSQTTIGDGVTHSNAGGKDNELKMHIEIAADFEKVQFAQLTQSGGTMKIGTITVDSSTNVSMIMSVGTGSASMVNHLASHTQVTGQPAQDQEHCMKCEVQHAKAPADIKACLDGLVAGLKPSTSKGDLDGYAEQMENGPSSTNATLFLDKQGLLHEIVSSSSIKVPNQPDLLTSFDVTLAPTAGSPDPQRFAVDGAWKCTAPPTGSCPAPPPDAGPQLLAAYKCFVDAIERNQAESVVV